MHLEFRKESKEGYMEVGASQVGAGYRTVKIGALLRVATLISKVREPRCTEAVDVAGGR